MTIVTGIAFIEIAGNIILVMYICHLSRVVMLMTINATKKTIISRCGVAIITGVPFVVMRACENLKIETVMLL